MIFAKIKTKNLISSILNTKLYIRIYHEAVGEEADAAVAEGGGGELEVAEVAAEDTSGQRHGTVDEVDDDGWCGQVKKKLELDP